jgi:predicted 3-demethylubiquinone-9 3-methyltransferase (glyoxalase superfamily)
LAERQVRFVVAAAAAFLIELLGDPNKAKAKRVMNAMMKMTRIDTAALKGAVTTS